MEKSVYSEFGFLGAFFRFMDGHPTISNILLVLEALAAFWVVLTYNFTTRI